MSSVHLRRIAYFHAISFVIDELGGTPDLNTVMV